MCSNPARHDFGRKLGGQLIIPSLWLGLWNVANPIGGIFGAIFGGYVQDRFGRRSSLAVASIISAIGVAIAYVSNLPGEIDGRRAVFFVAKLCCQHVDMHNTDIHVGSPVSHAARSDPCLLPSLHVTRPTSREHRRLHISKGERPRRLPEVFHLTMAVLSPTPSRLDRPSRKPNVARPQRQNGSSPEIPTATRLSKGGFRGSHRETVLVHPA